MTRTLIVVPCYNEAQRLPAAEFLNFVQAHPDVDFLFVNDGSRDGTLDLLLNLADQQPERLHVLNLPQNGGKAEAVRQGICAAISEHRADFVGFLDADLATPLSAIPQFCDVLHRRAEIDIVIGTRLALQGRQIERRPIRRLLGRIFATAASLALGTPLVDTQCGAKLFRATPAIADLFTEPFCTRWIFDVELLARRIYQLRAAGQKDIRQLVYELPIDEWRDVAGSKLKSGDFVKAIGELGRIYFKYIWAKPLPQNVTLPAPSLSPPLTMPERRAA